MAMEKRITGRSCLRGGISGITTPGPTTCTTGWTTGSGVCLVMPVWMARLAANTTILECVCTVLRKMVQSWNFYSVPTTTPGDWVLTNRVDRKSTRLNSSHVAISYAVFCLKKKKKIEKHTNIT